MDNTIQYLNTDLDLTSADDLTELAKAFEATGVTALHVTHCEDGSWRAIFETSESNYLQPEQDISTMVSAIESLSEVLRTIWLRCTQREFNIGYDCGDEPWEFNQGLSNQLLGRIAATGATLRITLYPDRSPAN